MMKKFLCAAGKLLVFVYKLFDLLNFVLVMVMVLANHGWACKSVEELDQCAYEMNILANKDLPIPTTDEQVVAGCGVAKNSLKCLKDDAEACMKGPLKPMVMKVMNDMEKHLNTHCDSPPHRAEFLKHVQCFTDHAKLDAVRLCADKHVIMLEKVSTLPKNLRIGGGCCSAFSFHECVIKTVSEQCSGETGDYFNDLITEAAEESINLVCNDLNSVAKCDAKFDPATWTELKSLANSNDPAVLARRHHYKTVVPIIIKMLKEARRR